MPAAMIIAGMFTGGAKMPIVPPIAMNDATFTRGMPISMSSDDTRLPNANCPAAPGPVSAPGQDHQEHQQHQQQPRVRVEVRHQVPHRRVQRAGRLLDVDEDLRREDDEDDRQEREAAVHQVTQALDGAEPGEDDPHDRRHEDRQRVRQPAETHGRAERRDHRGDEQAGRRGVAHAGHAT